MASVLDRQLTYWRLQAAAAPRKVAALGGLLALLAVIVGIQFIGRGGPQPATAQPPDPAPFPPISEAGTEPLPALPDAPASLPKLPDLPSKLARDVFAPPPGVAASMASRVIDSSGETNPASLSDDTNFTPDSALLQATFESSGPPPRRFAIIGGREVRVGDRLGAWRVSSIHPRQVTLTSGERSVTLLMP